MSTQQHERHLARALARATRKLEETLPGLESPSPVTCENARIDNLIAAAAVRELRTLVEEQDPPVWTAHMPEAPEDTRPLDHRSDGTHIPEQRARLQAHAQALEEDAQREAQAEADLNRCQWCGIIGGH